MTASRFAPSPVSPCGCRHRRPLHRFVPTIAALVVSSAFAACSTPDAVVEPPPPEPEPPPEIVVRDKAIVESVRVLQLESFPIQAFASVTGYLPDAATSVDTISQSRSGNTIIIEILTARPQSAIATTAIVPFDRNIPLEIRGLPAGEYIVDVNGTTTTFALARDNFSP